jgi:hypothetical protein
MNDSVVSGDENDDVRTSDTKVKTMTTGITTGKRRRRRVTNMTMRRIRVRARRRVRQSEWRWPNHMHDGMKPIMADENATYTSCSEDGCDKVNGGGPITCTTE